MKYKYHVSFVFYGSGIDRPQFRRGEITIKDHKLTMDDLNELEQFLEKKYETNDITILNFQLLD